MVAFVPVLWLCRAMIDFVLLECASCLNMRGSLSHLTSSFYFEAVNPSKHSVELEIHPSIRSDSSFRPYNEQYKCAVFQIAYSINCDQLV